MTMAYSPNNPIRKPTKKVKHYTRFEGHPQEHEKTRSFVAKCEISNNDRIDHQPVTGQLKPSTQLTRPKSHEMKIHGYRDRILTLCGSYMTDDHFSMLDQRSLTIIGSMAKNTEISIFSDLLKLAKFCHSHQYPLLPLEDFTFKQYLGELMAAGYKRNTLDRHIASIVRWHTILEMDDPRKSFEVRTRLGEIRQHVKIRSSQKEGLRFKHLVKAYEEFDPRVPRDVADMTLLFFAFDTLCRRSEIVQALWSDIIADLEDGSGIFKLDSSKTDQEGEGAELFIKPITMGLLNYWREMSSNNGMIFRGIYSDGSMGRSLSSKGVARSFKRIAKRLGFLPELFAGHSTRVGAAQEMAARDIPMYKIMLAGRWKEVKTLTGYMKRLNAKKSGSAELNKLLYSDIEPITNLLKHE